MQTNTEDTQLPKEGHILMDRPDERDVRFEDTIAFGSDSVQETIILPHLQQIPNQGLDRKYRMSCTRQALASIIRTQRKMAEDIIPETLGFQLWDEALAANPAIESQGDYLQEALRQAKDKGLIAGWYIVGDKFEAVSAMLRGHPLYTGSKNGDWRKVRDKKQYGIVEKSTPHCFSFIQPNENGDYIAINSYGNTNGYFTINENIVFTPSGNRTGNFFTMYAIVPLSQTEKMMQVLNERNYLTEGQRKAYNAKLYNGLRNKDAIKDEEAYTMCQRFLNMKHMTFIRNNLAEVLKCAWSGKEPLREPTASECRVMLDRVIAGEYTPTRGQVAELLGSLL